MTNDTKKNDGGHVEVLKGELEDIKKRLEPDEIAKAIDRSYLSINNIRAFLQILSIILTIFLAGAVYFGIIGFQNILKVQEKVQTISKLENEVRTIRENVQDISELFNKIAIKDHELLNAREQQLLILMASEIDPNNTVFKFNAANVDFLFGRYDEAAEKLGVVLVSPNVPEDVQEKARELKARAEEMRANPPQPPKITGGPAVGPYSLVGLHANTLNKLSDMGYLTRQEVKSIFDDSSKE